MYEHYVISGMSISVVVDVPGHVGDGWAEAAKAEGGGRGENGKQYNRSKTELKLKLNYN